MAKLILRDCFVKVNGITFSDHVSSVEVSAKKDDIDITSFSGSGREHAAGLRDTQITINFQQDFAASQVDATLFPLWNNETEFEVLVRPTSSAGGSATNPTYGGSAILLEYSPLAGKTGELSETSVAFPIQRGTFTRYTT